MDRVKIHKWSKSVATGPLSQIYTEFEAIWKFLPEDEPHGYVYFHVEKWCSKECGNMKPLPFTVNWEVIAIQT